MANKPVNTFDDLSIRKIAADHNRMRTQVAVLQRNQNRRRVDPAPPAMGVLPAIVTTEIPDASAGDGTLVTGGEVAILTGDDNTQGDVVPCGNRTHAKVPVNTVIYVTKVRGAYELLTVNCEPAGP